MATIALSRPLPPHRPSSALGSITGISIESLSPAQAAVPNKHIPTCPPGSPPTKEEADTPSTPASTATHRTVRSPTQASLLYPPDRLRFFESGPLKIFKIDAADIVASVDFASRQPLPDSSSVFPWFHGLHPENQIQQAFFVARRHELRRTPCCVRGITLVKADGDLSVSRLKGAIAPQEYLKEGPAAEFLEIDPKEGFCVRNFHIQAGKWATVSDIVIYGDDPVLVRKLAWDTATAQDALRAKHEAQGRSIPLYNTFICTSPFSVFEDMHPEVVAADHNGNLTGNIIDLFQRERQEMYVMTKASEISHNVWLGPSPDTAAGDGAQYDICIECTDVGRPDSSDLRAYAMSREDSKQQLHTEFPSSGSIVPPTWSQVEADGILETCKWIYHLAHGTLPPSDRMTLVDEDGDTDMRDQRDSDESGRPPQRILIHCADGYTESTMLGLAYLSFSTGRGVAESWLRLHTEKQRNFFAYPTDVALLTCIESRLLLEAPIHAGKRPSEVTHLATEPPWLPGLDGSLPSRVLDYMYLGNLGHANNPDLLKALGIGQILSVGETSMWRDGELDDWGVDKVCIVQGVQDNGIDQLTGDFERCLEFIDRGRKNGTATLVHCRVGVSRSATICIAEVMRELGLSFPRAYCFVRARRLNVIIQPHLRFAYELLKWEELLQLRRSGGLGFKRELEWGEITREIALMNRPYAR